MSFSIKYGQDAVRARTSLIEEETRELPSAPAFSRDVKLAIARNHERAICGRAFPLRSWFSGRTYYTRRARGADVARHSGQVRYDDDVASITSRHPLFTITFATLFPRNLVKAPRLQLGRRCSRRRRRLRGRLCPRVKFPSLTYRRKYPNQPFARLNR